ncbi:unnamed protein product [Prorocentrum cordatum]|uniref:Uncharacterized protein n=1 Tax=Prorocentrum cordatum TaxID=2364126 RepID=A0ABN9VEL7_9DINO|nr:unnamed protein product [Polarella glacialis]
MADDDDDGESRTGEIRKSAAQAARGGREGGAVKRPKGKVVVICMICNVSSNEPNVTWFSILETVDASGRAVAEPDGDLCNDCGWTCKSWPQYSPQQLATMLQDDGDFVLAWQSARERTKGITNRPDIKPASVTDTLSQGIEVYAKLAFVTKDIFETKWMDPTKIKGCKVTDLPIPLAKGKHTGVLLHRHLVPHDLPHFVVKVTAQDTWAWAKHALTPDDIVRSLQGQDTFEHKCKRRKFPLQAGDIKNVTTVQQVEVAVKQAEDDKHAHFNERALRLQSADQQTAGANGPQAGARRRVGGRVGSSSEDEAEEVRPRAARGGAPSASGGRSGGRGGRGRGVSKTKGKAAAASGVVLLDDGDESPGSQSDGEGGMDSKRLAEYEKMLNGVKLKRSIRAAGMRGTSTAKPLPAKEAAAEVLHAQIGKACMSLTLECLRKPALDFKEMMENISTLELHGVNIPQSHRPWISARVAQHYLCAGKMTEWVDCVCLRDSASDEWAPNVATFRSCMPSEDSDKAEFVKAWLDGVFLDTFMAAVDEASADGAGPQRLVRITLAFLEGQTGAMDGSWIGPKVRAVMMVYRGLLGLCSSVPAKCAISSADVEYVMPTSGAKSTLGKDLSTGRLILAKLKPSGGDHVWNARKDEFLQFGFAGPAAKFNPSILRSTEQLASMVGSEGGANAVPASVLDALAQDLAGWSKLRPGSLKDLEFAVVRSAEHFKSAAAAQPAEEITITTAKAFMDVLLHFTTTSEYAMRVAQDINSWYLTNMSKNAVERFEAATTEFMQDRSVGRLASVVSAGRAAATQDTPAHVWAGLPDILEASLAIATVTEVMQDVRSQLNEFWAWVLSSAVQGKCAFPGELVAAAMTRQKLARAFRTAVDAHVDWATGQLAGSQATNTPSTAKQLLSTTAAVFKLADGFKSGEGAGDAAWPLEAAAALGASSEAADERAALAAGANLLQQDVLDTLQRASHALGQVAGGAPAGGSWSDSAADYADILACFGGTLELLEVDQIIRVSKTAQEVCLRWGVGGPRAQVAIGHWLRKGRRRRCPGVLGVRQAGSRGPFRGRFSSFSEIPGRVNPSELSTGSRCWCVGLGI